MNKRATPELSLSSMGVSKGLEMVNARMHILNSQWDKHIFKVVYKFE